MRHQLQDVVPTDAPLHVVLHVEGDGVAVDDGGIKVAHALDGQRRLDGVRVVDDPVVLVVHKHPFLQQRQLLLVLGLGGLEGLGAGGLRLTKGDRIGRWVDDRLLRVQPVHTELDLAGAGGGLLGSAEGGSASPGR